jgi:hypothetical protein
MTAISREVGGSKSIDPTVRSIVWGTLLGDGYVYPNGTLQIDHAVKQQAYVDWKYERLKAVVGKPPCSIVRIHPVSGRRTQSVRFYTRAVFRIEREAFYSEGVKRVPIDIGRWLDPLALAVWYMDDGGRGGRTPLGMVWNIAPYLPADRELLQAALFERYGIQTTIQSAGSGTHLYIRARSAERFIDVVGDHIIPSMRYKLPLDPVTTEALRRGGAHGTTI